jgi:hypothetical protein
MVPIKIRTMSDNAYVIINADDFGMNAVVNHAILKSFNEGLSTSTTMLVNLEGFDEACTLASDDLLRDRVGLHVNLTEGAPLTDGIKKIPLFCDSEGNYVFRKNQKRILHLDPEHRRIVYKEIEAQIRKCRKAGINISHADSHNHMHEEPGLIPIFISALKANDIPYLRRVKDMSYHSTLVKKLFRKVCNSMIALNRLSGVDYFGTIDEYVNARRQGMLKKGSITEIMVHPGRIENGKIVDVCTGQILSDVVVRELAHEHKIGYRDAGKAAGLR